MGVSASTCLDVVGVGHEREEVAAVARGPVDAERLEEEDELVEHDRRAALELHLQQVLLLPVPVERELHRQLHLRPQRHSIPTRAQCKQTTGFAHHVSKAQTTASYPMCASSAPSLQNTSDSSIILGHLLLVYTENITVLYCRT